MTSDAATEPRLPDTERRLHRALIEAVLATGGVPPASALAAELDIEFDALRDHLLTLQGADYLALDAVGREACLYPFSPVPTPHVVVIGGERRFAMCSLDALGMAAMLGRPVEIESACPVCGTPVRLAVRPGAVASVAPAGAMVVAKRDSDAPACDACCSFTVFACGLDRARELRDRTPDTSVLDVSAALEAGESIFGGFLADTLPAKRKRLQTVTVRES